MKKLFLFLAMVWSMQSNAQTCCSGGVPLSSNLGMPVSAANTLQLNLSYDLNVLETLKSGRITLEDDARSRKTHSILFQAGYSLTEQFSVDLFFSWVRQERVITQFGNQSFTNTEGIGDAVVLFKYKLWSTPDNSNTLVGAIGGKLPTGSSTKRDDRGILLNADLQPGSGAYDGIIWGQYNHLFSFRPSMSLTATTSYNYRGKNNDYLGSQVYQFGNEWQLIVGVGDRVFIGRSIIDPSLSFRYRTVDADQNNGQEVPSTGGQWLFINPSITYWLSPDLSFNGNVELPLVARITGTQVTPTYRINTGIYYRFWVGKRKDELGPINPVRF